jgi:hypothetical protein
MRTGGEIDTTKITVVLRNFPKAPKNDCKAKYIIASNVQKVELLSSLRDCAVLKDALSAE